MKSARACELVGLTLLAATAACNSQIIPVALILDSGIEDSAVDAMTVPCGALEGGRVGCPDGQFCSFNTCGSIGKCEAIPRADSCGDDGYAPECDCNGVTYFNDCLRRAATANYYKSEPCQNIQDNPLMKEPLRTCSLNDSSHPCDAGESCVEILPQLQSPFGSQIPPDAGIISPQFCMALRQSFLFSSGACWVLPPACSESGAGFLPCEARSCLNACDALKKGGLFLSCQL